MPPLPHALPPDILKLIEAGQTKEAAWAIAGRYEVSSIEGLRAVSNVMGGVAADADFRGMPPDEVFGVSRSDRYLLEVRRAPTGSRFRDEFKLIDVDPETGKRWNSVHFTWDEAMRQAEDQFRILPSEWQSPPSNGT